MNKKQNLALLLLLFFSVIIILYHFLAYIGHYGYDDMEYAEIAKNLTHSQIDFNNHFSFRLPVYFTALSYQLFGMSDFSSSLPGIVVTISILLLVFLILRDYDIFTLFISLSLTTLSNWFIFYSDKLMPDIYVAFFIFLSLYILHEFKFRRKTKSTFLYASLFALSLFAGFTAKETIILIIPLLGYFFIIDFIQKKSITFWLYSFLSGLLLIVVYFSVIGILTGDFFKRFHAIQQNSYINLCSYDQQPFHVVLKRISYELVFSFFKQAMFTGFIFIIAFAFQKNIKKYLLPKNTFSFFLISAALLILSSNFMTISFKSYVPMCLDVRHYLFLTPIVAIPSAIIIMEFIRLKQFGFQIIIALIVCAVLSYFQNDSSVFIFYFALSTSFIAYYFAPNFKLKHTIFIALLFAILITIPLNMVLYARKVNYWKQKEIVEKYILQENPDAFVITNPVQKRLLNYYNQFKEKDRFKYLSFNEYTLDTLKDRKQLLLLNYYTEYLSGLSHDDLPYFAQYIEPESKPLFEDKDLNIAIYELKNINKEDTVFSNINDFEKKYPFWEQHETNITSERKFKGNQSFFVDEYSSTFILPLDTLLNTNFGRFIIKTQLFCNFDEETKAQLVISVEKDNKSYIWQSIDVQKYLEAYSNWWPIQYAVKINKDEIQNASTLKIYVWNSDKKRAYIDNFSVNILGY